jgi:carbon storage regulator
MIGDDVVITVVDIRGDKVRLGIDAPTSIPVHRQEVYDAIKRENEQASKLSRGDVARVTEPKKQTD